MIFHSIHGPKGHIALTAHGDDGKIHLAVYRRQGRYFHPTIVCVGKFSTTIEDLKDYVALCEREELRVRALRKESGE